MKRLPLALVALAIWLAATPVLAQCTLPATAPDVDNPSAVAWCPSADHALLDSYELDILRPDATVLQTLNLGKPVISTTDGSCTAPINVQPIAFSNGYTARVRAKAGTAVSVDAPSINKFNRRPGGPAKLLIKAPEPLELLEPPY